MRTALASRSEELASVARLVTLNIAGPSVERAIRLAEYLLRLDADAYFLTETRANTGTRLVLDALEDAGYTLVEPAGLCGQERGAAIAHRLRPADALLGPSVSLPHRLPMAHVSFGSETALLVGAYVPSRDASPAKIERKEQFLKDLVRAASTLTQKTSVILMGDFNVVSRSHLPRYAAFRRWEYDAFDDLLGLGLVDAHDLLAPGQQVHSWIGRHGDGYRYDYGFVSKDLGQHVRSCDYVHEPRINGLSDHAAVSMTVDLHSDRLPSSLRRQPAGAGLAVS